MSENAQQLDVMEVYKRTKEKLKNWPLMECSEAEITEWFKETVGPTIAKITLSGDRVEELIIVDELYDAATEALNNMPLPADFPEQPNVTKDQLERDFADYCKAIVVRTATVEQLALQDESISPEILFIRPVTTKMKFQGFLEHWDRQLGFSEGLRMLQCPFDYTPEEKKMLFGFAHMMNCLATQAKNAANQPGNVDMFKMD